LEIYEDFLGHCKSRFGLLENERGGVSWKMKREGSLEKSKDKGLLGNEKEGSL